MRVNRSKRVGTQAESAVVEYLRQQGFPYAERRALNGSADKGDVNIGDPSVVVEVKRCKTLALAAWMDETETERKNAGADVAVCWHWRRGKGSPGEWYCTMTGETLVKLLGEWTR